MTQQEIRQTGIEILSEHIGVVGMIRFLQQNDLGYGNYTKDKESILKESSVEELVKKIQQTY
ncbi:MAG: hypothetical protein DRQ51_04385 [Gammaproteobacteria bacterium]|nr:MAG: hypothetical protein DRQ51_04385 [Gammaproteobacteria bacterium]